LPKQLTTAKKKSDFDPHAFISTIGNGREMISFQKKETIFAQGDPTDGLFFIQKGKVRLSVVSERGKEATLAVLRKIFLWRKRPCWPASPHVVRDGNYGLRAFAYREESHDAGDESGTQIVGHVSQISAKAEHAISG
jgi:CRP-like cAMP-binding protein